MNQTVPPVVNVGADLVREGHSIIKTENENQTMMHIQKPRNEADIYDKCIKELEVFPDFAAKAFYSIPYKNDQGGVTNIEGLSIGAAMTMCRRWGNCANGFRIVEDHNDRVIVEGVFIDYETGARTGRQISVPKTYWSKQYKKEIPLRVDRLNMAVQSGGSKAVRNAILATLPMPLKEAYFAKAKQLALANLGGDKTKVKRPGRPESRLKLAKDKFIELGVTEAQFNDYVQGAGMDEESLIVHLIGLFNSIQDGQVKKDDVFGQIDKKEVANGPVNSKDLFKE